MRVLFLLGMMLCVVHGAKISIQVIQRIGHGNCHDGCSHCCDQESVSPFNVTAAQEELKQLSEEVRVLEEDVANAVKAADAVSDAGEVVTNLTNAVSDDSTSGGRHRRTARNADLSYQSCEDSNAANITGTPLEITIVALEGILNQATNITENLDAVTKLICYIAIAQDLTAGFESNAIQKPANISSIRTLSNSVIANVNEVKAKIEVRIVYLKTDLTKKKAEIKSKETKIESEGAVPIVTTKPVGPTSAEPTHGISTKPTWGISAQSTTGVSAESTPGVSAESTQGISAESTQGISAESTQGISAESTQGISAESTQGISAESTQGISAESTVSPTATVPSCDYSKFDALHSMLNDPKCSSHVAGVTENEISTILSVHNDLRAKVARGQETQGDPGPQPNAANMRQMVWNDELALVAQAWANQCTLGHDCGSCRKVCSRDYAVGQNIYYYWGYDAFSAWTDAVNSWYNEVADMPNTVVDSFTSSIPSSKVIGHYTQVVWAKTYEIGCGKIQYITTLNGVEYPESKVYVCNYGPAGNYLNTPMYIKGTPASQCTGPVSTTYPDLCE